MGRRTVLLILAIILILILIIYIEKSKTPVQTENLEKALELQGISGYLNTPNNTRLADFKGKIILIDFWTYSCINCIRTIPHLVAWNAKYKDKGLVIIGVHTPEFEFEKDYQNVLAATQKFNITYPVVQDNDYKTWNAFGNQYWPRKYLIDTKGVIRYDHIGEGGYEETEKQIQELLSEIGQNTSGITDISDKTPQFQTTPELYLGYAFMLPHGQDLGNSGGLQSEKEYNYSIDTLMDRDKVYLVGKWKSNRDNIQTVSKESHQIILNYTAQDLNIVADSLQEPISVEVLLNGKPISPQQAGTDIIINSTNGKSYFLADQPRLYNLVKTKYGNYQINLNLQEKDFTFNSLTFG